MTAPELSSVPVETSHDSLQRDVAFHLEIGDRAVAELAVEVRSPEFAITSRALQAERAARIQRLAGKSPVLVLE